MRGRRVNKELTEVVVFVPMPPGSRLQRKLQVLDESFCKLHKAKGLKFVEKVGRKVKDVLRRLNPWAGAKCPRGDCWSCREERQGMDTSPAKSVVYKITCNHCQECR